MDRRVAVLFPAAVAWFGTGVVIGALMAIAPERWLYLRPAHIAINLFGWMSMLMYAMTYHVIPVFIRRQLHRPQLIKLQMVMANLSVLAIFAGHLLQFKGWVAAGWGGITIAGVLFLVNIIGAATRGAPTVDWERRAGQLAHPALDMAAQRHLDKTARPFTEISVVYLILGSAWTTADQFGWVTGEGAAAFLIRYGWLAMMVFGTSYHMLPRLSGRLPAGIGTIRWQLLLANIGVVMAFVGTQGGWAAVARTGMVLISLTALIYAVCMSGPVLRPRPAGKSGGPALHGIAHWFAIASWAALILAGLAGLGWAAGGSAAPYGWFLGQTHLYLLGWMTLLVYAVVGIVLPLALERPLVAHWLYGIQLAVALPGVVLVAASFLLRASVAGVNWDAWFGTGATLCAVGGLIFGLNVIMTLVQFLTSGKIPRRAA